MNLYSAVKVLYMIHRRLNVKFMAYGWLQFRFVDLSDFRLWQYHVGKLGSATYGSLAVPRKGIRQCHVRQFGSAT